MYRIGIDKLFYRRNKMKKITQTLKKTAVNFWNDEEAQGMIEYILIMVAVVGIVVAVGPKVKDLITGKTTALGEKVNGFDM